MLLYLYNAALVNISVFFEKINKMYNFKKKTNLKKANIFQHHSVKNCVELHKGYFGGRLQYAEFLFWDDHKPLFF